ncbi:permease of the major facilitator superfamily [Desulfobacula toluolica Tol2]|uniref:Permease of the major facilitator superfamily n=1 Tax=Desulfobacula toluolica (strain DSM 7467 / Tol2) TaxID=651182 RepID=K0N2Y3_DESTT|nr:permease of the major facilitator superfamily [Desulfobacula toluolica Tol2]
MLILIPSDHKGVFVTLFFAIFSTVTGVGIVVPLLPVYANDLGATGIYVGLIFGSFSLSRTFLMPLFGRLSDQKGRKPFILAGLFTYTLISIAFMFSNNVETLILLRFVQGAGSAMIMPVVQAYIGEITPAGSEGYAMGLFNLSSFLSLSLGPLMGGGIKDLWSLDAAFMCMGVLSGIGLLLCIFFLPPTTEEKTKSLKTGVIPWSNLLTDKSILSIFIFRYAYTSCIGIIWCFLPVFADTEFNLSGSLTGVLVMLGVFISGILNIPMGYVADRANKRMMILAGGILSTIGMLLLFQASCFYDLVVAISIFGVGGGISMPAIMGYAVIKGDEKKAMGSVISIITVAHSLGMLTGSMAAGLVMDFFSLRLSFPCGMIIMALGTLVFFIMADRNSFVSKS